MPGSSLLPGDERLARSVTDGDSEAFGALYERYQQPLLRYCRSILAEEADSQDAVQSAFARALAALQDDRRDAPLRPWLYRIAHNEAISVLRRRRTRTKLSERLGNHPPLARDLPAERERFEVLIEDLHELPVRQRRALLMRELSGMSHEEIGAALETSSGNARQAIFEARRALHELADGRASTCDEILAAISAQDPRVMSSRRLRAHLRECASCAAVVRSADGNGKRLRGLIPALWPFGLWRVLHRVRGSVDDASSLTQATTAVGSAGAAVALKPLVVAAVIGAIAAGGAAEMPSSSHPVAAGSPAAGSTLSSFTTSPLAATPFTVPLGAAVRRSKPTPGSPINLAPASIFALPGAEPAAGAQTLASGSSTVGLGNLPPPPAFPVSASSGASPASGQAATQSAGTQSPAASSPGDTGQAQSQSQGAGQDQGAGNQGADQGQGKALGQSQGGGGGNSSAQGKANGQGQGLAKGQGNGNGNGNGLAKGQGNGNGNGNGNGKAVGQANGNGQANGQGNGVAQGAGNGNGQANGQANGQGPGVGSGNGNGQANGQANGVAQGAGNGNGQANGQGVGAGNGNGNGQANGLALGAGNGNSAGNGAGAGNGNGQANGLALGAGNGNGNGAGAGNGKANGHIAP